MQSTRKEEKRTVSPIQAPGNTGAPKEQITPRLSIPVDAMNEEVPEEKISEKIGLEELLDDNVDDEVILYPGEKTHRLGDEHEHKAVGSER